MKKGIHPNTRKQISLALVVISLKHSQQKKIFMLKSAHPATLSLPASRNLSTPQVEWNVSKTRYGSDWKQNKKAAKAAEETAAAPVGDESKAAE